MVYSCWSSSLYTCCNIGSNSGFWALVLAGFIAGAILSGLYPALFLSSFKPTTVFQGVSELKVGGLGMRRILVIFQFATSLLLIAGTLTVYTQISYMKNHDLLCIQYQLSHVCQKENQPVGFILFCASLCTHIRPLPQKIMTQAALLCIKSTPQSNR